MTSEQALSIIGPQPQWVLRSMTHALQRYKRLNTPEEQIRLIALKALGYGRKRGAAA